MTTTTTHTHIFHPPSPDDVAALAERAVSEHVLWRRREVGEPSSDVVTDLRESQRECVEQIIIAARLLDREQPGWFRRVRPASLRMASLTDCLLGQLFGSFSDGLHAFVYRQSPVHFPKLLRAFQGDAPASAWKHEVERRLALVGE